MARHLISSTLADASLSGTPSSISVTDLTGHNVSGPADYNKDNSYYRTGGGGDAFTGTSHKDGTTFSVDNSLVDDSCNTAAPVNISKLSTRTFFPATWGGKVFAWTMFYSGLGSHTPGDPGNEYTNAARVVADIFSRGYDGIMQNYYGQSFSGEPGDTANDDILAHVPSNKKFALALDQQFLGANYSDHTTWQQHLMDLIDHMNTKYWSDARYETYNGRPILLMWDGPEKGASVSVFEDPDLNWSTIKAHAKLNGNPLFIWRGSFTKNPASEGGFSWVDVNADNTSGVADGTTYLTKSWFPLVKKNQSLVCCSTAWPGFNGTMTATLGTGWSDNKYIARQKGTTWINSHAANKTFIQSGQRLDYIFNPTWDDYQEGTTNQGGIDNEASISSMSVTGHLLNFTVSVSDENTINQYNLYKFPSGATGGTTGTLLDTIYPGATKQFDLSKYSFTSGTAYDLYIQAQGKPQVLNALEKISYTPGTTTTPSTGILSGVITDSVTGNPISGATVSGTGGSATTAADGSYTFPSLAVGAYSFTVYAGGYASQTSSATITANATTTLSFALVATAPTGTPPPPPVADPNLWAPYFLNSTADVAMLETIEIFHENFSQIYRFVRNSPTGITATLEDGSDVTFDYLPVRIQPVASSDDLDQVIQVQLGDLNDIISVELDNVAAADGFGSKPTMKYRVYRSDDLSGPISGPLLFEIVTLPMSKLGSAFEARAPRLNQLATGEIYSTDRFTPLTGFLA
jgi:hypothetical protein